MQRHTKALLELSTLLSPVDVSYESANEIIESPDTSWNDIIDFANQHLMVPALYSALQHKKLLERLPDTLIIEYLATVYSYNLERNKGIVAQLQDISDLLSEINVTPVLLKGAAALSEGYYHHIGARVMSDIDILVPEDRIHECIDLLEGKGEYKPVVRDLLNKWNTHQYQRIYTENGSAALELHYNNISQDHPYFANEDLMRHIRPSKIISNAYVIEPSCAIYHIFLHSELQDECHINNTLQLTRVHHAAMIATACADEISWNDPGKEAEKYNLSDTWNDYLDTLHKLFQLEVPAEAMGSSDHLQKILGLIEKYNAREPKALVLFGLLQESFSCSHLKHRYKLKSKAGHSFAIIWHTMSLLKKYLFSSEARNKILRFYRQLITSKRFGK